MNGARAGALDLVGRGGSRAVFGTRWSTPWLLLAALSGCLWAPGSIDESAVESSAAAAVADAVRPFVSHYRDSFGVPAVTVAVIVLDPASRGCSQWAEGFGAPADAIFRVGSVGKWVTAVAALRLAEQEALALDAPLPAWPSSAGPGADRAVPTLRQLLGHRGGIVRQPPIGHLMETRDVDLASTVAALRTTPLLAAPGERFVYSNAGYALVGAAIEHAAAEPFAAAMQRLVFEPAGMRWASYVLRPELGELERSGKPWTYDARALVEPTWATGVGPAVDLRCSAIDLAQFARHLLNGDLLPPSAWSAMTRGDRDDGTGAGLGCFVANGALGRLVCHDGTVHGSSATLQLWPDAGIAVAVCCDIGNAGAFVDAIAERAARAIAAARRGEVPAPDRFPQPVGAAAARQLAGSYRCGAYRVELREASGELFYDPDVGMRTRLRVAADGMLVSDDLLSFGERRLQPLPDGRLFGHEEYYVRDDDPPAPCPAELLPLLGEYGPDHAVLTVLEQRGRLAVLADQVVHDIPEPLGGDRYRFPPGMYDGDDLRFERAADGRVVAAWLGAARLLRRPEPPAGGWRLQPLRPIAELVQEASRLAPPSALQRGERAPELVVLAELEPSLRCDLRYATADNFVGAPVYPASARACLQRPAAEALVRVQQALAARGLGLLVFDAYRPWSVTKVFWEATPPALREFVADPAQGSRHNRGCAVDLTLCDLATGRPLAMPSEFDEFTPRAAPDYAGGTSAQRWARDQLRAAMGREGFSVNPSEWWHFDHDDWRHYGVGNTPLP